MKNSDDFKVSIIDTQRICFKGQIRGIDIFYRDNKMILRLTCLENDIGWALNNETIEVHCDTKMLELPSKAFELNERLVVYGFLFIIRVGHKEVNVVVPISLTRDKKEMSLEDFKKIVRLQHGVWTCDINEERNNGR